MIIIQRVLDESFHMQKQKVTGHVVTGFVHFFVDRIFGSQNNFLQYTFSTKSLGFCH